MTASGQITATTTDIQIKICGLSTREAVEAAAEAGATHYGLVHFEKSPRHVTLDAAAELRRHAPPEIKTVLLLVNAEPALTQKALQMVQPDVVQFHGSESLEWLALVYEHVSCEVWKAIGVRNRDSLENANRYDDVVDRILYDAPAQALPGGTGIQIDWSLLGEFGHQIPWGLAGGLDPDNVAEALRLTRAPLVDVSSGVESAPGIKDVAKIAAFCKAVQSYEQA